MAAQNVPPSRGVAQIAALLDSPEIARLIADLQETRWTGRPGYPLRAMVGLALIKSVYALPTWSRAVRLVAEHPALQGVLGVAPSIDATYRFTAKLRKHGDMLTACLDRVLAELREAIPDLGANLAIDSQTVPVSPFDGMHSSSHRLTVVALSRDRLFPQRSDCPRGGGSYIGSVGLLPHQLCGDWRREGSQIQCGIVVPIQDDAAGHAHVGPLGQGQLGFRCPASRAGLTTGEPAHPELVGWDSPYRALVFLTLSARKPILGVAKAPWVKRQDQDVTYRRAFEVLEQPAALV